MPLGYEYKRYFIILQEEDKGYAMTAGKIPTGYVKIEIKKNKVKVSGFIQNMKSDMKSQYKLNLLAPSIKLVLSIGLFRMDGTGRGEFYSELDSDNVLGSNLSIDEFTGAMVIVGSGIPLIGYTGRDSISWRDWYGKEEESQETGRVIKKIAEIEGVEEVREPEPIETIEEKEEIVEVRKEEPVEDIIEMEEVREEELTEEIEEKVEAEATREIEELAETEEKTRGLEELAGVEEVKEKENITEVEETREAEAIKEIQKTQDIYIEPETLHYSFHGWDTGNLVNQFEVPERHKKDQKESETHRKLHDALRAMEKYDGFYDEYGVRWYRVGRELPLLNEVKILINESMMPLSYPFIAETGGTNIWNCTLGVEHRNGEVRYVYIGIPGKYNQGCRPCYEYKGFTAYKRTKDKKRGYWIMCMDIIKGRICRV